MSWIKKRQRWILDTLSLGAVLQYCAYRFLQSTMFNFYYSNTYKLITMGLLLVFGGIRYLYIVAGKLKEKNEEGRKKFIFCCIGAWILALPFFYVGWKHDYKVLIFIPICCMCLYDMEAEKILKAFVWTIGILLTATVLCSLSGTVRNLVQKLNNGKVVGAYGIVNSTDLASYCTFILLSIWCVLRKTKWSTCALFALITGIVSFIVYSFTDSRTVLIISLIMIILVLWDCININVLRKKNTLQQIGNWLDKSTVVIFPLIGIATIILVYLYGQHNAWIIQLDNNELTGRLAATWEPYRKYGISPFGTQIDSMHGKGATILPYWSNGYGYLDVGYAMLAIKYGWVITGIVIGLWMWMTAKALRQGNHRITFTMAIMAIHAFSEARILDVNYNIFLIMPFCTLKRTIKEECEIRKGKPWISFGMGCIILVSVSFLFPRILSWLRTLFASKGWNNGLSAIYSLFVSIGIVVYIIIILKAISYTIKQRNGKSYIAIGIVICVGLIGSVIGNNEVGIIVKAQADRLDLEDHVIQRVLKKATLPVYVAEPSELYARRFTGFSDHVFSTEELCRAPQGTIFVDENIEALGIVNSGGLYTQISEQTGIYSYDNAVIEELSNLGYEWKTFYNGQHIINRNDVAVFNNLKPGSSLQLVGNQQMITSNAEADQSGGVYEVCFSLSHFSGKERNSKVVLKVMGEAGEEKIAQKDLHNEDFDSQGRCVCAIQYRIRSVPKVSYSIETREGTNVCVENIYWRKISDSLFGSVDCSSNTRVELDGSVLMQTKEPGNEFNALTFQLYDAATGVYLLEFGSGNERKKVTGEYVHNLPSGQYYLRLKGNTNLSDEWAQALVYLKEGMVIQYDYTIEEIESDHVRVKEINVNRMLR